MYCENVGMRHINGSVYYYSSYKTDLSSKYNKRSIMCDSVNTSPLDVSQYK